MAPSRTLSVGMEVHKASSAVAAVAQAQGTVVGALGPIATRQCASAKLTRQRRSPRQARGCVSAAGPCGAGRSRSLRHHGSVCGGVAPSERPTNAGDRVTTDRRDAMHLARRMRAGDRTPGYGLAVDDEAIRALRRARAEPQRELQAAQ